MHLMGKCFTGRGFYYGSDVLHCKTTHLGESDAINLSGIVVCYGGRILIDIISALGNRQFSLPGCVSQLRSLVPIRQGIPDALLSM